MPKYYATDMFVSHIQMIRLVRATASLTKKNTSRNL